MSEGRLTAADLEQLASRGIEETEARRQFALLAAPPPAITLDRPATVGDGIERLPDPDTLAAHGLEAAACGRVSALIPASGAASRMFKEAIAALLLPGPLTRAAAEADAAAGRADAAWLLAFADGLPRFAFRDALAAELSRRGVALDDVAQAGPWRPVLDALLSPDGLACAEQPKGLLPFHRYASEVRTAFDEHLVEAAHLARSRAGVCRLHFTVPPAHRSAFAAALGRGRLRYEARFSSRFQVDFSEQKPSTDTLAGTTQGEPFRDEAGRLLLRPAGHGALIENLAECSGDLVLIKNVDNVAADRARAETLRWGGALLGELAALEAGVHAALRAIEGGAGPAALTPALALASRFGHDLPRNASPDALRAWMREALHRPIRVCGMVPNTGEPGGGPFWVREHAGGTSLQIVESAQVDTLDPGQRDAFRAATHFNPVFLACALRDHTGRPYDLHRFVDPEAIIVTQKSWAGRDLLAMERPGLWNGAMARWNTVFAEVPLAVFNPVKTVMDLLRPEHQGDGG